ncbi:MAG: DUF4405 domain-containing protein [Desulforhopalus sp.]|nr:DUF4405 domain-containing protein [Desulforhopalus sp.]
MRKITSMTMLVSLALLLLNSIVLYVVPEGRVAYWADWRFLGLTKTEWGDQHLTIGFLFIIASLLHLYYNWPAVKSYMKNKIKEIKVFTLPFNLALLLTVLVTVMTYFQVPPVSLVLDLGEHFKKTGAEKHGEPPYGHAELSSLKMLCQKEGIDLEKALELLAQSGIKGAEGGQTVLAIAQNNGLTPRQVYTIILPAKEKSAAEASTFPDAPMPGFGRMNLEQVCNEFQLDCVGVVAGLQAKGLTIDKGKTIHELAGDNGQEPMQIFEAIRSVVVGE